MSITLGSMTRTATLNPSANLAVAKHGGIAIDPFGAANQRVEQQLNPTAVKLSSFSQIKSGFADVQTAAKDLSDPKKTATSSDIAKAAQSFATAYNAANNAVDAAVNGDGKKSGSLAGDVRARIASTGLRSIVTGGSNVTNLKKIGISLKPDGTLAVDTTALQNAIQTNPNAVKDTLSKIGKQAEQVSAKELATTGNVGSSVNTLSNISKNLEAQLAEQKRLATASQDAVQRQVANITNTTAGGVASYLQTLSL